MAHSIVLSVFEFDLPIMNARFIVSLELKWRIVLNFIDHTYTRALAEWRDFKLFGTARPKHCSVVMYIVYFLFTHLFWFAFGLSIIPWNSIQSARSIERYSMRECFLCLTYLTA